MTTAPHVQIANTMLLQLGGQPFCYMTGAKDLIALTASEKEEHLGGLQFGLPRGLAKKGINKVRILLLPSDTYRVEALKVNARSLTFEVMGEAEGVYGDQLAEVFRDLTGLATSL